MQKNQVGGMTLSSLEFWKSFFEIGAVVLLFATALAGALVWYFTARVSRAKDAESALFRQESIAAISAAEARSAEAHEKAATAEHGTAKALVDAAEANRVAESFRLDIAKANERAAQANEIAEKERLARLQLEAKLAPRRLSPKQQGSIAAVLKGAFVAQIFIYADTTEVQQIGDEIASALSSAGWSIGFGKATGGIMVTGVAIAIGRDASAPLKAAAARLVVELERNGISASLLDKPMEDIPGPGMIFGSQVPNPQIRIMIGSK